MPFFMHASMEFYSGDRATYLKLLLEWTQQHPGNGSSANFDFLLQTNGARNLVFFYAGEDQEWQRMPQTFY